MPKNSTPSDQKVAANRANSKKSSGPRNTTSTRFNAIKHGLLAAGITELDDADGYRASLRRLHQDYATEMSDFLKEQIALHIVRLRRIARLEAEQITSILNPAVYGEVDDPLKDLLPPPAPLVDPGLPASMSSENVTALVNFYERYRNSIENSLFRVMNQLDRLQRIQKGEDLPAPVAVDVSVHANYHDAGTNVEPMATVLKTSEQPGPEIEAPPVDASVVDDSAGAQPWGMPSGPGGNPTLEPPAASGSPEGSEDENISAATSPQGSQKEERSSSVEEVTPSR